MADTLLGNARHLSKISPVAAMMATGLQSAQM